MSVKHSLLALLYKQPMHGYELGKQLSLAVNAEWDVKPGQIANTLARLKEARLVDYEVVETTDAPDRKVYTITEQGIEVFAFEGYELCVKRVSGPTCNSRPLRRAPSRDRDG